MSCGDHLWKCCLRSLLSSSAEPVVPRAVKSVDHDRTPSPVCQSLPSQQLNMSWHAPTHSLGWFLRMILLRQPSTPNLRATICQLAATSVPTSSFMYCMSGVDETSRRAEAPGVFVVESFGTLFPLVCTSGWFGKVSDQDETWWVWAWPWITNSAATRSKLNAGQDQCLWNGIAIIQFVKVIFSLLWGGCPHVYKRVPVLVKMGTPGLHNYIVHWGPESPFPWGNGDPGSQFLGVPILTWISYILKMQAIWSAGSLKHVR